MQVAAKGWYNTLRLRCAPAQEGNRDGSVYPVLNSDQLRGLKRLRNHDANRSIDANLEEIVRR
jgi:hypothetical protein